MAIQDLPHCVPAWQLLDRTVGTAGVPFTCHSYLQRSPALQREPGPGSSCTTPAGTAPGPHALLQRSLAGPPPPPGFQDPPEMELQPPARTCSGQRSLLALPGQDQLRQAADSVPGGSRALGGVRVGPTELARGQSAKRHCQPRVLRLPERGGGMGAERPPARCQARPRLAVRLSCSQTIRSQASAPPTAPRACPGHCLPSAGLARQLALPLPHPLLLPCPLPSPARLRLQGLSTQPQEQPLLGTGGCGPAPILQGRPGMQSHSASPGGAGGGGRSQGLRKEGAGSWQGRFGRDGWG